MPELLLAIGAFAVGLLGLIWSANIFVGGSAATAQHLGMSRAMIGLTVVALGTSAPEMIVSAGAALEGEPGLGIGNAVGSNIANIGLVLGVTALLGVIPVARGVLRLELPLLLLATLAAIAVVWDGQLLRLESSLLLFATILLPVVLLAQARAGNDDALAHSLEEDIPDFSRGKAMAWLLGGLIALLVSADVLVWGATQTATALGVSPMVIGLTIVALGTSLPELAASVASAIKGHYEMALGNIVGSNILNILAVMSLPGILAPGPISAALLQRDMVTMTIMTVVLALLMWRLVSDDADPAVGIGRKCGLLFLAGYIAYYAVIALQLSGN